MKKITPKNMISFIDLTQLIENDTEEGITLLCEQAAKYHTASVCVPLKWVQLAKSLLMKSKLPVATVANFPSGVYPITTVREEILQASISNADELDFVIPYQELRAGNIPAVRQMVSTARNLWPYKKLKCILETGTLNLEQVRLGAEIAIGEGADFLKTSTGKIAQGAQMDSFTVMLETIYTEDHSVGIKASGGLTTYDHVLPFMQKAAEIMGDDWVTPKQFRIGASQLLTQLTQIKTKTSA